MNRYPLGLKPLDEMTTAELIDELQHHIHTVHLSNDMIRQLEANITDKLAIVKQINDELDKRRQDK